MSLTRYHNYFFFHLFFSGWVYEKIRDSVLFFLSLQSSGLSKNLNISQYNLMLHLWELKIIKNKRLTKRLKAFVRGPTMS